ncbi:hypothetical protein [Bradyrhizobium sp. USDA 223]|uniref:hypothetical protein n=1 Tax=Bradyrhizobium sp. USDA 223 TaxID=3156306 RepID=UPI0038393CA7
MTLVRLTLTHLSHSDAASYRLGTMDRQITPVLHLDELQAYDAMVEFLDAYWRRDGMHSDDIAMLLGGLSRSTLTDKFPSDPAMWEDWMTAVGKVKGASSNAD